MKQGDFHTIVTKAGDDSFPFVITYGSRLVGIGCGTDYVQAMEEAAIVVKRFLLGPLAEIPASKPVKRTRRR